MRDTASPILYRRNPNRARIPRVFAGAGFQALLEGAVQVEEESRAGFRDCLKQLYDLYPVVANHRCIGGYDFYCGFEIAALWSDSPIEPDVFFLLGPEDDRLVYWPLLEQYERSRDERLLTQLIPVPFYSVV